MRSNGIKWIYIFVALSIFIVGCDNATSTETNTGYIDKQEVVQMDQLIQENVELKKKVTQLKKSRVSNT